MYIKRLVAYTIDYLVHSVIFMICSMIVAIGILPNLNPDAPFVIIFLIYRPIGFIIDCEVGNYIPLIVTTMSTILACQTIIYSMEEYLKNGQTVGKRMLKIKVDTESKSLKKIIIRNILKSISVLLIGIPFISIFFNEKKTVFYDSILSADVKNI